MKKIKLHPILIIAILSCLLYLFQSLVQTGFEDNFKVHICAPWIILLNILPIFLIMSFIYFIFNRIWVAFLSNGLLMTILLTVNDYKIFFRDEPLKPADLGLIRETAGIMENYRLEIRWGVFIPVIILIALIFIVFKFVHEKKVNTLTRIIGLVLVPVIFAGAYMAFYHNDRVGEYAEVLAEEYYEVDRSEKQGYMFYFLSNFSKAEYKMPKGYTDETANEILSSYEDEENEKKVNVIAIMSEAFADLSKAENLEFEDDFNPLKNIQELRKESMWGNIIVNGFGGGTSYTEFEFLTGASPYLIDSAMPEMYKTYINSPTYSLAQAFADMGYNTEGMHPGHAWFYNRKNVYLHMGFKRFVSDNVIDTKELSKTNYYVDDAETGKIIKEMYETHKKENPDTPYFHFTVTLQNHGPYMDYETERGTVLKRPEGLSDELYYTLNNYFLGLSDADAMLFDLTEYFNEKDEPVVIVFFGDHLPYIDAENEGFDAIGYDISPETVEGLKRHYSTPYIIWGNDAFKKTGRRVGQQEDISANFLSVKLFDYLGIRKPRYFQFLSDVSKELNVISSHFFEKDGELLREIPEESKNLITNYQYLQYYNIVRFKNLG